MVNNNEKKQVFNIKLSLDAAKKLLTYFDEEFLESYEQFIETIEKETSDNNDELEYYGNLREILEDFTYELKKEIRRKDRAKSRDKSSEILECESIRKKLDPITSKILKEIEVIDSDDKNLICRFFWYIHSSYDKTGELIFSEHALEELLELDRYKLEKFLKKLTKIEVTIGNKKGKLLEGYKFLNVSTIKIKYNIYIIKPYTAQFKDQSFKFETSQVVTVKKIEN